MKNKRNIGWKPPKNASDFFNKHYDDVFKAKHPILYFFIVIAICLLVVVGPFLFCSAGTVVSPKNPTIFELFIILLGAICSFGISIGLCNLFTIVINQYLGHWVTLISFAIGIFGSGFSLFILWIYK